MRRIARSSEPAYGNASHTLQRLCELLVEPGRFYNSLYKYSGALDKCVTVSSTLELAD